MGTVRGRQAKFRLYPNDHLPIHAHAKIGSGEVIIEVRRNGKVALSTVHREAVVGNVKDAEVWKALEEVKHPRIVTTAAEVAAAGRRARSAVKGLTAIIEARYARAQDAIVVRLNTGSTFSVPRRRLSGLTNLAPAALRKPQIEPPGNSLWFDVPDVGVRLETLMIAAAGENTVRSAAAQLLGSRKSSHKAASSAANGRLGGRPPKSKKARAAA